MLLLKEEDVKLLLTMEDCIKAVEESYRAFGLGEAVMTPRENLWLAPPVSLKLASAALTSWGYMGTYVYPGGYGRKGSNPFSTILYNSRDGRLLAFIESSFLSWYRTGATSAVATKHLALKDSDTLGIIGTGRQAWTQLRALSKVMEIKVVKVYSRTLDQREKFASDASRDMGIDVKSVVDAKVAGQNVDIVVTATTSKEPVFHGEWLGEGVHVNAIGAHYPEIREVDTETVKRSKVIVDSREQALKEKGELLIPIQQGLLTSDVIYAELGEVVAGKVKGREEYSENTLFCSGGISVEQIGVAAWVYEAAVKRGLGAQI